MEEGVQIFILSLYLNSFSAHKRIKELQKKQKCGGSIKHWKKYKSFFWLKKKYKSFYCLQLYLDVSDPWEA